MVLWLTIKIGAMECLCHDFVNGWFQNVSDPQHDNHGVYWKPVSTPIPIRFQIFHSSDEVREQNAQKRKKMDSMKMPDCCPVVQVLSDCQLVEIEGWQDRTNLVLHGIKPDEFWESEICSLSPSANICIWWPHPQDGKVALFARVRDVRLQERKGIANPFYDIGDGARGLCQCHWGSLGVTTGERLDAGMRPVGPLKNAVPSTPLMDEMGALYFMLLGRGSLLWFPLNDNLCLSDVYPLLTLKSCYILKSTFWFFLSLSTCWKYTARLQWIDRVP